MTDFYLLLEAVGMLHSNHDQENALVNRIHEILEQYRKLNEAKVEIPSLDKELEVLLCEYTRIRNQTRNR